LCGWKIDIKSHSQYFESQEDYANDVAYEETYESVESVEPVEADESVEADELTEE